MEIIEVGSTKSGSWREARTEKDAPIHRRFPPRLPQKFLPRFSPSAPDITEVSNKSFPLKAKIGENSDKVRTHAVI
ncbi:hypothetical protein IKG20_01690 [Candidatus Saccharibacteria bacterium]|nr:hypothetical protein [Candidatus Saccharibacteria bacterium]